MTTTFEETASFLRSKGIDNPEIGVVLGTGLHKIAEAIETIIDIPYASIPNFPLSTVESHSGILTYGTYKEKKVLLMKGRFHFYEGYNYQQIVFPIRVMKLLGIKTLLLSNASGCINLSWKKGELMLLDDHINLHIDNPLVGKNIEEFGTRFPDLSAPYDLLLNQKLIAIAKQQNTALHQGVYASIPGPNLETKAEYRYLKIIGADAVGMSTVPEVIAANHMGLPCAAISVLTDECDPDKLKPVSLAEIIAVAEAADKKLSNLFLELIATL